MYTRCPKCGHSPLPLQQALPAACPACGVILAKMGSAPRRLDAVPPNVRDSWRNRMLEVPERVDPQRFWGRVALLSAFAVWGAVLARLDHRTGEFFEAFLHRPLLVFHEAGHVIFRLFGEWMTFFGGTLLQLLMPVIMGVALLWKNRDPFGASLAMWLLGVSLLDVAPYVYDAKDPQLMLLSGSTGEEGGHDWIYLLRSVGLLHRAHGLGQMAHLLGVAVMVLAIVCGAVVMRRQYGAVNKEPKV
jgi:hypothetical protein